MSRDRNEEAEVKGGSGVGTDGGAEGRLVGMLDAALLGDVDVELTALLGRGRMTLGQLASLKDGEVVPLDTAINGLVELSLNGRNVARGELVSVGDSFGVRITEILVVKP